MRLPIPLPPANSLRKALSMYQKIFAERVAGIVMKDPALIGLAAGGSWIINEMDEFSDLDLVLVTGEKISDDQAKMTEVASGFGKLLSSFIGDHVGEPRLLICLYDDPLLHVDIKFVTTDEFAYRVETPVILVDKNDQLKKILASTSHQYPYPNYQWIEDRFWTWIHYALLKVGRGEYMEAHDFLAFLRMTVLGPLMHIKNGGLPRGVRKVEMLLPIQDINLLISTTGAYDRAKLLDAISQCVNIYEQLSIELFPVEIVRNQAAKQRVSSYLDQSR